MFTCFYCGIKKDLKFKSEEHIIPESCGGSVSTLQVCGECNGLANIEIDNKFKDEWLISLERAKRGITGKVRNKSPIKHVHKTKATTSSGKKVKVTIKDDGMKLKLEPTIVYPTKEKTTGYIQADPSQAKEIIEGLKKKHKNLKFQSPLPQVQQTNTPLKQTISIDIKVLHREQIKILLGLSCLYVPNFKNSVTADRLRKMLWHYDEAKNSTGINIRLYPEFNPEEIKTFNTLPNNNIIRVHEVDGIEMRVINSKHQGMYIHKFAYYRNAGRLRVFLNLFDRFHAFFDTFENYSHFTQLPIQTTDKVHLFQIDKKENQVIDLRLIFNNLSQYISVLSAVDMMKNDK